MRLVGTVSMLAAVAATSASALAADVLVPQDVPNLKDALLAAQPGDRVIVTSGVWRNGRVVSDIDLVGRFGATLTGLWEIQGAGATVEGFAVRDGSIEIEAADVTVRGNRFSAPKYTVMLTGTGVTGATIEGNRFISATAQLNASGDLIVRGNRVSRGEIILFGSGMTVEDNVLSRDSQIGVHDGSGSLVARTRGGSISMHASDDAVLRENSCRGRIGVTGGRPLVIGNEVGPGPGGIYANGDDAIVADNRLVTSNGSMIVQGARPVVRDNFVDNRTTRRIRPAATPLLLVRGAGPATVLGNEVRHRMYGGLRVESDESEIAQNVVSGTSAWTSLAIVGSRNNVHDNALSQGARIDEAVTSLVVMGDENSVADCTVAGASYDGVSVDGADNLIARIAVERVGRCGITVAETAASTGVAECTVVGARWAALFVLGTGTTITGGSFTDGRKVDVLDLGTGTEFVSATFATKSENEGLRPYR